MGNLAYIGLDIGKQLLSCSAPGRKPRDFSNDRSGISAMLKFLKAVAPPTGLWFVMESTGGYSTFTASTLLELAETQVSIVPPGCVLGFKRSGIIRSKTDHSDALAIRLFAESRQPRPWLPPPRSQQRLRDLQLVLEGVRRTSTRLKCLREKLEVAGQTDPFALASVARQLAVGQAEIARLEAEIEAVVAADQELARDSANLLSIPGIGTGVRNVVLALCYRQLKELSQRKLLAHCGMCPQEQQSGQLVGRVRMNKAGDPRIRRVLYMAALSAVRPGGLMHDYFQQQQQQGKPGKSALVSVMRKLLYLIQAIVKSGQPFDLNHYLNPA